MKLILKISLACLLATGCASKISAQTYVKLNGLYALVGVVNPAVEFTISPKSTFQTEIVVSPWKSINNSSRPLLYLHGRIPPLFQGAQPRLVPPGANIGMQAFDLSKPYIENWKLKFENRYSKGYGFMIGLCVGYDHIFPRTLGARRLPPAGHWMTAFGALPWTGEDRHGSAIRSNPNTPDPVNGSSEWYPNKIRIVHDRDPYFQSTQEITRFCFHQIWARRL